MKLTSVSGHKESVMGNLGRKRTEGTGIAFRCCVNNEQTTYFVHYPARESVVRVFPNRSDEQTR